MGAILSPTQTHWEPKMDATPERLIRDAEVRRITALPTTTRDRLEAAGQFPKRVKCGPRLVAWCESEVQAWIRKHLEARRAA